MKIPKIFETIANGFFFRVKRSFANIPTVKLSASSTHPGRRNKLMKLFKFKQFHGVSIPRCSMYVIFTYSYNQFKPNVGKYTISMEHLGYILSLPGTVIEKYMANRPYILVHMDPPLTYLLVSVPSILTLRYLLQNCGIHFSTDACHGFFCSIFHSGLLFFIRIFCSSGM